MSDVSAEQQTVLHHLLLHHLVSLDTYMIIKEALKISYLHESINITLPFFAIWKN